MNTKIHNITSRVHELWLRHGHGFAVMLCGLLIGSLLGSFVQLNQAAPSEEVLSHEVMTVLPSETVSFSTAFASLLSDQFTLRSPVIVKKGEQRVAYVATQSFSSSSSVEAEVASSVSSSSRIRERVRLPKVTQKQGDSTKPAIVSSSVSSSASSVVSSISQEVVLEPVTKEADADFPAFGRTLHPVTQVPNWGAMTTPAEWNRSYSEMTDVDFVAIPKYDLSKLTIPMETLLADREANEAVITAKLYYSTRYMGTYDLDAGEHSGTHPGIDLKLARGTLVGSIAGGKVVALKSNDTLGKHIIIEHRLDGVTYFSLYAHLDSYTVSVGDAVKPGQGIGRVGMTGKTGSPHLHLEVRTSMHGAAGSEGMLNPMTFILTGGKGG